MRGCARRPSDGAELRSLYGVGTLDDLDLPAATPLQRLAQFRAGIAAVREYMAQPRPAMADRGERQRRAAPVLNVRAIDDEADHQAECIHDDLALFGAALEPVAGRPSPP